MSYQITSLNDTDIKAVCGGASLSAPKTQEAGLKLADARQKFAASSIATRFETAKAWLVSRGSGFTLASDAISVGPTTTVQTIAKKAIG